MRYLTAVLEDCERHGIRLVARGDRLEVRGPLARVPELREDLLRHKPGVLCVLRTGRCHHELPPGACKLCNGYVRQLIERLERQESFVQPLENSPEGPRVDKTKDTIVRERKTGDTQTRPVAEPREGEDDA